MKKKKIIAMIPARLGSQRIPKKNLRYLGGRLLVEWVAEACIEANIFDEIYINSESEVFKGIALNLGVNFFHRPTNLATNEATNDDFGLNFINSIESDILVQVNPTSPFTSSQDIKNIVCMCKDDGYETVHTVKNEQIEGIFSGTPLNFDPLKKMPPSQELEPIKLFTSSVMAWDTKKFKENMAKAGCAVYGGDGKIGYYTISGAGIIDIDNEKDFAIAEAIIDAKNIKLEKKYYEV